MTTRMLIRCGRPPHQPIGIEAAHAYRGVGTFSTNSGNLLFQDAIYRTLRTPETELVVDSLSTERRGMDATHIARINDEIDVLVLPLANAFRDDFVLPLTRLTEVVEQLRIPVVVTCIGGQSALDQHPGSCGPEIDQAATRFVRAVLDRSESIGVRGDLTKTYLESLGFPVERLDVVGCPSLHLYEPGTAVAEPAAPLTAQSRVAVSLTGSVPQSRSFLEHNHARFPNLTYVAQDSQTLGLLLWGDSFEAPPGMPGSLDHYLCTEDKIRFFADPTSWLRFLATQDFACGTRIHGNVAALLAGIPAYQLVHDSRTLELARFHRIPYEVISGTDRTLDAAELHAKADLSEFNAARDTNRAAWLTFLGRNGLPHRSRPDPDYDALVAAASIPDGIGPLPAAGATAIASRLRWLHQGLRPGDAVRTHGAYLPDFVPAGARQSDVLTRIADLRKVVSEQATVLQKQRKEVQRLSAQVDRQRSQIAVLTQATRPLYRRAGGWLRRSLGRAAPARLPQPDLGEMAERDLPQSLQP